MSSKCNCVVSNPKRHCRLPFNARPETCTLDMLSGHIACYAATSINMRSIAMARVGRLYNAGIFLVAEQPVRRRAQSCHLVQSFQQLIGYSCRPQCTVHDVQTHTTCRGCVSITRRRRDVQELPHHCVWGCRGPRTWHGLPAHMSVNMEPVAVVESRRDGSSSLGVGMDVVWTG